MPAEYNGAHIREDLKGDLGVVIRFCNSGLEARCSVLDSSNWKYFTTGTEAQRRNLQVYLGVNADAARALHEGVFNQNPLTDEELHAFLDTLKTTVIRAEVIESAEKGA